MQLLRAIGGDPGGGAVVGHSFGTLQVPAGTNFLRLVQLDPADLAVITISCPELASLYPSGIDLAVGMCFPLPSFIPRNRTLELTLVDWRYPYPRVGLVRAAGDKAQVTIAAIEDPAGRDDFVVSPDAIVTDRWRMLAYLGDLSANFTSDVLYVGDAASFGLSFRLYSPGAARGGTLYLMQSLDCDSWLSISSMVAPVVVATLLDEWRDVVNARGPYFRWEFVDSASGAGALTIHARQARHRS